MADIFITLANMSINATYIVAAILLFKLIIKKSPRWIHCLLWALVSFRLIIPFSLKSALSIIPSTEAISHEITVSNTPQIKNGIIYFNNSVNDTIMNELPPSADTAKTPVMNIVDIASIIWLIGCVFLVLYAIFSYINIKKRVSACINISDNVYICDNLSTPFVLGVFKPRIYIPSNTLADEQKMILAHENAHIKRMDHLWKPLAYLLLCVYWFNPIMWVAYIMLCKDIELACDEKVIQNFSPEEKKSYSVALLNSSIQKRFITACPLAFGETGVKSRVKNIFNYKKTAFWIVIISIILCVALAVFFLTDPKEKVENNEIEGISDIEYFSDIEEISAEIINFDLLSESPSVTVRFTSDFDKSIMFGDPYCIYKYDDVEWIDCDRTPNNFWNAIGYPLSNGGVFEKTYTLTTHDLDEKGRYKFETDFLIVNEPLDKNGERKRYYIGFTFNLDTVIPYNEENLAKNYNFLDSLVLTYNNSPDPIAPCIRLNSAEGTYMFTYSVFSSHVSIGEYSLFIDKLVLKEFGTDNIYTFNRVDDGFEFIKDESTSLPKYSYSEGAPAEEPVPDRAVFKSDNYIDFISNTFDAVKYDVDKDGIEEEYTLSVGPTSEVFTIVLSVTEEDYQTSAVLRSEWVNPRFIEYDGKLKIAARTQTDAIFLWDVEFDGEKLNIPQLYREQNPPSTAKVNYGYVTEVGDNNKYIIVSEGYDGYIHTNNSEFSEKQFFKFYTDSQKTAFSIGDKVRIVHTGEFSYEAVDDIIPTGVLISLVEIVG